MRRYLGDDDVALNFFGLLFVFVSFTAAVNERKNTTTTFAGKSASVQSMMMVIPAVN